MPIADSRAVLALEHHVTRTFFKLPTRVHRMIGRSVARPEGVPPAPEIAAMLALSKLRGASALGEGTDVVARRAANRHTSLSIASRRPDGVLVARQQLAGATGPLDGRLYVPPGETDGRLLLYIHGGGYAVGGLDTHDNVCRFLAVHAATRVIATTYRLAPEHPFPAGVRDVQSVMADIVARASDFGGDADKITVAGDSAGGNLAAVLARRFDGGPRPAAALLIYPGVDMDGQMPSRSTFADGFVLERDDVDIFSSWYLGSHEETRDPELSPLYGEINADHPPTVVITAAFDPLRDEGEAYAAKLRDAGVPTVLRRAPGQVHGFANLTGVSRHSRDMMLWVCAAIRCCDGVDEPSRGSSRSAPRDTAGAVAP